MTNESPKIYVADLAAYNAGKLHGVWIDATDDMDDIWNEINAMLQASPELYAEEWAIHDYECFQGYSLDEYEGIEAAHKIALFVNEHGKLGAELLDYFGGDIDDARKAMEERYIGKYKSLADYAEEIIEQTTDIPEHLSYYIDYERMARDWDYSGEYLVFEIGYDEVHIFYN